MPAFISPVSASALMLMYFLCVSCILVIPSIAANGIGAVKQQNGYFSGIYSFGDSLADTGNGLISNPASSSGRYPYGRTFFHFPTGRYCDGRIVIDFLAESLDTPFLKPFLQNSSASTCFRGDVNFAVAGATALNASFLQSRGVTPGTPYSLGVQIEWFLSLKRDLCASRPPSFCDEHFRDALFVMGEIGGNDFNIQFWNGTAMEDVEPYTELVADEIESAIRTLITRGGARQIFVQNNLPIGCSPSYLSLYAQAKEPRDAMGCMPRFNGFACRGNAAVNERILRLRAEFPEARIVWGDMYGAMMELLRNPEAFGMENLWQACCGSGGGDYNFDAKKLCGFREVGGEVSVCEDPCVYVNWDGIHLTEAAYRNIAWMMLEGPFSSPPFYTLSLKGSLSSASPAASLFSF